MPEQGLEACGDPGDHWYSYAVLRIVPRVERDEFINAGVILYARTLGFLQARIELDEAKLRRLAPDVETADIAHHLEVYGLVAAGHPAGGPIAALSQSERFHWLTSPRSTAIQTSPVHVGRCDDPAAVIEQLMDRLVR